jgi:HEAT repeat protein
MTDGSDTGSSDAWLLDVVNHGAADIATEVERVLQQPVPDRKAAIQSLQRLAEDDPDAVAPACSDLTPFLEDDERAVRLTAAKLFVTVARSNPAAVEPLVSAFADRLADQEEFYYVRARTAEVLGYVARECPDAVASPDVVADLRIGLSFDEPEVKEKLAKGLEGVALGDPKRLEKQVPGIADHLDDENDLVRYHLTTTLAAVACESPAALADAIGALTDRLDDDDAHVRGRAAEALGLLARSDGSRGAFPEGALRERLGSDGEPFAADRTQFALDALRTDGDPDEIPDGVGSLDGLRDTTEAAADAVAAPDAEGECPHCGLALPGAGPPMCPRCGGPY